VALVAILAVSAHAASVSFNDKITGQATLGYPNRASAAKAGGDTLWGAFAIGTNIRPNIHPSDDNVACLVVMAQMTSQLADATASFCAAPYATTPSDPTGNILTCAGLNMDVSKSKLSNMGILDMTPTTNGTAGYVWPAGIAVGATVTKCTSCASTSDFAVTALVAYTNWYCTSSYLDTFNWAPVVAVDDKNTWTFAASGSAGSGTGYQTQPALVMLDTALSGPYYALATPDGKTGSMHIAYRVAPMANGPYPNPSFPNPPSSQTASQQSTTIGPLVAPLGTAAAGPFRTGSVSLSAPASGSAWFIAPYVDAGSSWTLAIGYGHEPAAAFAIAPSLLLASIFAILAMLL